MLASVTMCNDDISNYNSKISDLGYLTPDNTIDDAEQRANDKTLK